MSVTPSKQPEQRARFVVPGMRPSPHRLAPRNVYIGIVCLFVGFTGIFFGGGDAVGQMSLIAGSIGVLAGFFAFRGFRITSQRERKDQDIRKLYGTPKV